MKHKANYAKKIMNLLEIDFWQFVCRVKSFLVTDIYQISYSSP